MDKIIAKRLTFNGCHGVLAREKNVPQRFIVDLEMYLDLREAGLQDNLDLTVNYDEVFHQVANIVENESYNLIEALAQRIAGVLLNQFPLQAVEVTLYKPDAPVEGEFDYFAVKIKREKKERQ